MNSVSLAKPNDEFHERGATRPGVASRCDLLRRKVEGIAALSSEPLPHSGMPLSWEVQEATGVIRAESVHGREQPLTERNKKLSRTGRPEPNRLIPEPDAEPNRTGSFLHIAGAHARDVGRVDSARQQNEIAERYDCWD